MDGCGNAQHKEGRALITLCFWRGEFGAKETVCENFDDETVGEDDYGAENGGNPFLLSESHSTQDLASDDCESDLVKSPE